MTNTEILKYASDIMSDFEERNVSPDDMQRIIGILLAQIVSNKMIDETTRRASKPDNPITDFYNKVKN